MGKRLSHKSVPFLPSTFPSSTSFVFYRMVYLAAVVSGVAWRGNDTREADSLIHGWIGMEYCVVVVVVAVINLQICHAREQE